MPEIKTDMSALEFLQESRRMSLEDVDSFTEFLSLSKCGEEAPAVKVAYMLDWCSKHPKSSGKTRVQDFLEKYPQHNAEWMVLRKYVANNWGIQKSVP